MDYALLILLGYMVGGILLCFGFFFVCIISLCILWQIVDNIRKERKYEQSDFKSRIRRIFKIAL